MDTLISLIVVILVLLFLELLLFLVPILDIRKMIVNKIGAIPTVFLAIFIIAIVDVTFLGVWPSLEKSELFKWAKHGILIFFFPTAFRSTHSKRGDKK